MSIVQFYKSMVRIGSNVIPLNPNGGSMAWSQNHAIPAVVGNFWQENYIEGAQMPTIDIQPLLIDGTTTNCPLLAATMNSLFMTRSNDYAHDVSSTTMDFFDGFSGWNGITAKGGAFTLTCARGEDVRLSMSMAAYGTPPSLVTAAPAAFTALAGAPIRFQSLSFSKNGSPFDGVVLFEMSYSNNLTPDMSMAGTGPQSVLPVDVNAGMLSASFRLTFQANASAHIAVGDSFSVNITQNVINTTFLCKSLIPDTIKSRDIGSGRQMRTYAGAIVGTTNLTTGAPVQIS